MEALSLILTLPALFIACLVHIVVRKRKGKQTRTEYIRHFFISTVCVSVYSAMVLYFVGHVNFLRCLMFVVFLTFLGWFIPATNVVFLKKEKKKFKN